MAEILRTDLTSATDRALHPGQHNEVNARLIALEQTGGTAGPAGPAGPPGASSSVYGYTLSAVTTPPPASGQARTDTAAANTATHLWLSYLDAGGAAIKPLLLMISDGDEILIQDKADSTVWASYAATADATDTGTCIDIPVTYLDGTASAGSKNQAVLLFHLSAGIAVPLNELPAQTAGYDTSGYAITAPTPTAASQLANKGYVDGKVPALPLTVANGGTGGATAAAARTNLGLGLPIPVASGGTGATDAATARTNLGITAGGSAGMVSAYKWEVDF